MVVNVEWLVFELHPRRQGNKYLMFTKKMVAVQIPLFSKQINFHSNSNRVSSQNMFRCQILFFYHARTRGAEAWVNICGPEPREARGPGGLALCLGDTERKPENRPPVRPTDQPTNRPTGRPSPWSRSEPQINASLLGLDLV